jgi:hypothetical protein
MDVSSSAQTPRRAKRLVRAQIGVRVDVRVAQRMQVEADARNVELATIAREHIEASVLGTGAERQIDELGRRFDELLSAHREATQADIASLRELLDGRLAEIVQIQSTSEERLEGLAKLFKKGFEQLGQAFLTLQSFLENKGVKK